MSYITGFFVIALACVCVSTTCDTEPFNDGGLYNLYSLSAIYGCNSDVEGRVAANGPVFYENYSVGLVNQVNEWFSLVSSSTIDFTSGTVWHGGVIGGDVTNLEKVSIIIDGELNRADECCIDSECEVCVSTSESELPLDFDVTDSHLLELSLFWSDLPATEDATIELEYQALELTCGSEDFNHFTGVSVDGVTSLTINCLESQTVLISYTEDTVSFENLGISLSGVSASKIIHHFTGPTLTISGVNVLGAVFAPFSDVFFPQGLITGQVFAGAFVGSAETVSNVSAAEPDSCARYGGGHAIVTGPTGAMLFDESPQAIFVQNSDGTATITGRARNGEMVFDVEALLTGYTTDAPSGSPKEELKSSCYAENGGEVDTTTWEYYETISGTLTGVADSTYAGAVVSFVRKGPSAQVGFGANGKNVNDGLSFWFDFSLVEQSTNQEFPNSGYGDFNLDRDIVQSGFCPNGQINRNPFDGCVPSTEPQLVCCQYESNGLVNNFCAQNTCVDITGWNLLSQYPVSSCEECSCPDL